MKIVRLVIPVPSSSPDGLITLNKHVIVAEVNGGRTQRYYRIPNGCLYRELRDRKKDHFISAQYIFYTAISWLEHSPLPMHKTNCNGMFLLINPKWPPIFFASLVAAWSCKLPSVLLAAGMLLNLDILVYCFQNVYFI